MRKKFLIYFDTMEEPSEIEQWKRISILGSGAFGVVSLWKHTATEDYIAIKKCKFKTDTHLSEHQRKRWVNEVDIMKNMNCPNIVSFKPLPKNFETMLLKFNPTNLPLLSMEYCTKGNLRHVLNQVQNSTGLQESDVRVVLADIANGVSYLHKLNITHRDIKPDNIVLQECSSSRPGDIIYKLIDLGYAKELNDSIVSFVGTLHYLAPEIFKTEKYDYSVDYWSLGIVTFEIICGVLPFLPQYTAVERFPYIQKKKPEHICIYQLQSGSVAYSSELLKENHISSCLKENMENWLRHTLHYDPAVRGSIFPDHTDVFQNLLKILDKKIINVFSVYSLEFYSYEINDGTLVSTLKDWIARDTKVPKNDQVLLSNLEIFDIADDKYVIDILSLDDFNLFVFKRGAFINKETFKLPKSVTTLFEKCSSKYNWRELRLIYTKSLFFLTKEEKMLSSLKTAFKLCTHYIQNLNVKLQDNMRQIHKTVSNVLIRIDCYHNLHSNSSKYVNVHHEGYKKYLLHFQHLLTDLEQCIHNVNELIRKVDILIKRQGILDKVLPNVIPVVDGCDISMEIQNASGVIMKGTGNLPEMSPIEMVKIISRALKEKDKLLNNKNFQSYGQAMLVAVQDVETLQSWMHGFHKHVKELSKAIDDNQREHYEKLLSSSFKTKDVSSKFVSLNSMSNGDTDSIISENQDLRCQMEEALGQLLVAQTSFCEELKYCSSQKY